MFKGPERLHGDVLGRNHQWVFKGQQVVYSSSLGYMSRAAAVARLCFPIRDPRGSREIPHDPSAAYCATRAFHDYPWGASDDYGHSIYRSYVSVYAEKVMRSYGYKRLEDWMWATTQDREVDA